MKKQVTTKTGNLEVARREQIKKLSENVKKAKTNKPKKKK